MLKSAKVRFATLEWLEGRRLMSGTPLEPGGEPPSGPTTALSPAPSTFHVETGTNGWFTQVVYNGVHYIDEGLRRWSTDPWFIVVTTDMNGGDKRGYTSRATSQTYDPQTRTLVQNFPEAKLTWTYSTRQNQLSWDVTVENTMTDRKLVGYNLLVTSLQFSSTNFERVGPQNIWGTSGGVQATRINDGDNAVYIINDNPGTQHMLHFQQFAGSEQRGEYRIRIGNARLWGDGATYPVQDSVIILEPGQTDRVALSLKFAPAVVPTNDANPELVDNATNSNPFRLNWADRRPIGAIWLHGSNHALSRIDTSTPAGVAEYQRVAIATAHQTVQQAHRENLQGVVFWDIEGTDQFRNPDPYAYAGDPRLVPTLNPAFDAVADQFFQILRDGGLRVGFTIRNSELIQTETSWQQTEPQNPASSYESKVRYAKERWGATLFYVDTPQAHDIEPLKSAAVAHPDVLLMPEVLPSMSVGFNAFSAPMYDQRVRGWGTAQHVRDQYEGAFSVVWVGDTLSRRTEESIAIMRQAVANGDILMAHVGNMLDISNVAASAGVPLIRPPATPPSDNNNPTTNPTTPPSNPPPANPEQPPAPPPTTPNPPPPTGNTGGETTPPPTSNNNQEPPSNNTGGETTSPPTLPPTLPPANPPTQQQGNPTAPPSNPTSPPTSPPPTTPPPTTPLPPTGNLPTSPVPPSSNSGSTVGNPPSQPVVPTAPPPSSSTGTSSGGTGSTTTPATPPTQTRPGTTPPPSAPPVGSGTTVVPPATLPPIQAPVVVSRPPVTLRPHEVVPTSRMGPLPPGTVQQSVTPAPNLSAPAVRPPTATTPAPPRAPAVSNGASAPARRSPLAGMAPSLLRNWSLKQSTVARSVAAAPVARPATAPPTYVAPVLTGRVRVNPLAIANSPSLFSSSSLSSPPSAPSANPLDSEFDLDILPGEAA